MPRPRRRPTPGPAPAEVASSRAVRLRGRVAAARVAGYCVAAAVLMAGALGEHGHHALRGALGGVVVALAVLSGVVLSASVGLSRPTARRCAAVAGTSGAVTLAWWLTDAHVVGPAPAWGTVAVVAAVLLSACAVELGLWIAYLERAVAGERRRTVDLVERLERDNLRIRTDLSRRLHGTLQQHLVMVVSDLERLSRAASLRTELRLAQDLARIAGVLDHLRESEVRQVAHELSPPAGLHSVQDAVALVLDGLPRHVVGHLSVSARARRVLDDPAGCPSEDERLLLVALVVEAVTNSVRHGSARCIEIRIDVDAGGRTRPGTPPAPDPGGARTLLVQVDDDGRGPPGAVRLHGLRLLADRLAHRGGGLDLVPAPGGGARLTARLAVGGGTAPDLVRPPGPRDHERV